MTTPRDPAEPGGAISDNSAAHGPATEAIPGQATGWLLGGRYRVIDRIGVGGMAEVFRAHDELLARDVAAKVFRTLPATPDTASGAERQEIELHALARLNHPNLITLFDGSISGSDGPAFLVMELINGPSLSARIADAPLSEPEAREVGIQIADALAYVHAEGMVHRDVKPANILLGTDRTAGERTVRARLSDFGIVRLLGSERLTSVDFTLGTASYLAPEQARGSDVGPVADVYSLGLVLIEALTGVRSFDGPALEAVMARLSRGPEVPADLPPPWPELLAAMTGSDPEARPTATQVAETLRDSRIRTAPLPAAASTLPAAAAAGVLAAAAGLGGAAGVAGAAGVTGAAGLAQTAGPAGPAGPAGAGGAGLPAAADAETVGLAAVGTGGPTPPAVADPGQAVQRPRRRWGTGWLLAALGLVAVLAVGALLLLRPSNSNSPADQGPGGTGHATRSVSGVSGNASASTGGSATRSSGAPTSSSARSGSSAPGSGGRSSSAPGSSPPPSSGATSSANTSTGASTGSTSPTATTSTPQGGVADPSPSPSPSPSTSTSPIG